MHSFHQLSSIEFSPKIISRSHFDYLYHANVTASYHAWWWLKKGHITIEIDGEIHHIRPGQWVLLPVGGQRRQTFEKGSTFTSINFSATREHGIPLIRLPGPIIRSTQDADDEALTAKARKVCLAIENGAGPGLVSIGQRFMSVPTYSKVHGEFWGFLSLLLRKLELLEIPLFPPIEGDSRMKIVLEAIRHRPQAGPLPFTDWRNTTGLSRTQLDRLSRELLGMSLHQFRDIQLLNAARKRLLTPLLIKQIAEDLGFVDTSHFCRWFRHHTGRSPQASRLKPD